MQHLHYKSRPVFLSVLMLCSCLFIFVDSCLSQEDIAGPSCIVSGTQYSYDLSGSATSFMYCVTGGTLSPSGTCGSSSTNFKTILVTWGVSSTHSITITSSAGNANFSATVATTLAPGTVSNATQNINYNTLPATISCSASTGGACGTPSNFYQWQQSANGVSFTNVSGATGQNLNFSAALTATTYYRRMVTVSGSGATGYSNTATVLVYPPIVAGSVNPSSQTINYARNASALTLSGVSGGTNSYTYQWQNSFDHINWYDVPGTTATTYTPTSLTYLSYFRVVVTSNGATANSNYATVNVNPQLLGGNIAPVNIVINSATSPGLISNATSASGGSCGSFNYQWQVSTNGTSFSNVSGAVTNTYTPGNLSVKTWYRRQVICGTDTQFSNSCLVSLSSGTPDLNYVRIRQILKAGVTDSATEAGLTSPYDVHQTTQYLDGLGKLVQTVSKQLSPLQKDIVAIEVYDAYGREANKYLPYIASSFDGNYKSTALIDEYNFNLIQYPNEQYYYGHMDFDASPLNRTNVTMAPGLSWKGSSIGVQSKYFANTTSDSVRIWLIDTLQGKIPTSNSIYAAGQLYKTVITDESNHQSIEYKDLEGHILLRKVQLSSSPGTAHSGWSCTYYVYDILDNLRFVIQPQAVQLINTNWIITSSIANELCFRYEYDSRKRMVIKKIPGAGESWMIYDCRDRVVLTQDSSLRNLHKWLYNRYDEQNRSDSSGLITDNTNYNNLNFHLTAAFASTNYPVISGYSSELLTQTFFDDYSWAAGFGLSNTMATALTGNNTKFVTTYNISPVYAVAPIPSYITHGNVTGSMSKVIGTTNSYLYSENYYDDHGRTIQNMEINYTGAVDTTTIQYDFTGKPIRNLINHKKNGNTVQNHSVSTKLDYDNGFRLKHVYKNLDNAPIDQLIDSLQYNELGQLKAKYLGNGLDSVIYDYNIQGWLTGINKTFVAGTNSHYFGMELAYDKTSSVTTTTYSSPQLNGNIAGIIWKSAGDGVGRKYDFTYDNQNRLTAANFVQNTAGVTWDATTINYSVGNLSYDANGNILSMNQYGFKVGGSALIDQLTYNYQTSSNKLNQVNDAVNDVTSKLGDFHYSGTKGSSDYSYDGNGNLILDNNKAISNIDYNYLNLPQLVHLNSKGNIAYTYDSRGNKLKKVTSDSLNRHSTTTLYLGGFVYQQTDSITNPGGGIDTLQFIAHEEGRVRWAWHKYMSGATAYGFEYDFFEKDHIGNTRMVLSQQKDTVVYLATMEAAYRNTENQLFGNITTTGYKRSSVSGYPNDVSVTNPNDSVSRVNGNPTLGQKTGPNLLLKVMSGDKIDIGVQYYFNTGTTGTPGSYLNDVLSSLATGVVNMTGGSHGSLTDLNNTTTSPIYGALTNFMSAHDTTPAAKPKAYLNWILLDDQFKYVSTSPQSGAIPVNTAATLATLGNIGIPITKNGYLYIWVSNETPGWDVFFDNLSAKQYTGPVLEESHYYPFGLSMSGICDKAIKSNYSENKFRFSDQEFQSKEFSDGSGLDEYDYGARLQDAQLGLWHNIDPLCDQSRKWSPYSFTYDNPLRFVDPNGMEVQDDPNRNVTETIRRKNEEAESYPGSENYSASSSRLRNVYIIIARKDEEALYKLSRNINQGAWHFIISSSIEEANKALGAYLDGNTADNIVVSAHGGTVTADRGGGSMDLNMDNANTTGSVVINQYMNDKLSPQGDAVRAADVEALQSVMSHVAKGGNFIVTGCQAGLGQNGIALGESLLLLNGCRDINVFLNQDLSQQKYTYRGDPSHEIPTGYASVVNDENENRWGITGRTNYHEGWLKFTTNELIKHVGILQLNAAQRPYVNIKK